MSMPLWASANCTDDMSMIMLVCWQFISLNTFCFLMMKFISFVSPETDEALVKVLINLIYICVHIVKIASDWCRSWWLFSGSGSCQVRYEYLHHNPWITVLMLTFYPSPETVDVNCTNWTCTISNNFFTYLLFLILFSRVCAGSPCRYNVPVLVCTLRYWLWLLIALLDYK